MFIVNVPDHVEHQEAYISSTKARIINNALKTFSVNFPDVVRAVNFGSGSFFTCLQNSLQQYGKLTEKQIIAVRNIIAKQDEQKALFNVSDESSNFVGAVGSKKVEFTLTVNKVIVSPSAFGVVFTNIMSDKLGNVVVYKGSKQIANEGDTITLVATIKEHVVYNRKAQTIIQRPTVTSTIAKTIDLPVSLPVIDNTQAIAKARQEWKEAVNNGNDELADERLKLYMTLRNTK